MFLLFFWLRDCVRVIVEIFNLLYSVWKNNFFFIVVFSKISVYFKVMLVNLIYFMFKKKKNLKVI